MDHIKYKYDIGTNIVIDMTSLVLKAFASLFKPMFKPTVELLPLGTNSPDVRKVSAQNLTQFVIKSRRYIVKLDRCQIVKLFVKPKMDIFMTERHHCSDLSIFVNIMVDINRHLREWHNLTRLWDILSDDVHGKR